MTTSRLGVEADISECVGGREGDEPTRPLRGHPAPRPDFAGVLAAAGRTHADRVAFRHADGTGQSFAETWDRVRRLADGLDRIGLRRGDRLAIVAEDSFEYMELLLACLTLGVVYVPINYRLRATEVERLVERSAPSLVVVSPGCRSLVEHPRILTLGDDGPDTVGAVRSSGSGHFVADGRTDDEDICCIAFTSGTTGDPKGVLQSQRMLTAEMWSHTVFELAPGQVRYTASAMFHTAGHRSIYSFLAFGCTTVVLPQFDPGAIAQLMQSGQLHGCLLVPTMVSMILEKHWTADDRAPNLGLIQYGGGAMHPTLLRRAIDAFGCGFINCFGSTESGLQLVLTSEDHRIALAGSEHLLGSLGRPPTGVDVRVLREDGTAVPVGEVGQIVSRSDATMSGYLDDPDASRRSLREGWLWGGDLARLGDDGYLFTAGRRNDLIVRGGENIYPAEIEQVLTMLPEVVDAAVVGRPDPHWGEIVVAHVECHGAAPSVDRMTDACRAALASYKVPVGFVVERTLPRNASGKVLRHELGDTIEPGSS